MKVLVRWLLLACLSSSAILVPIVSAAPTVEELQAQVTKLEAENAALRKEVADLRQASAPAAPVDINTATRAQLEKVPGIGRKLAERIIAGRPWKSVDDLKSVDGFGAKTFEMAKPSLTVGS